MNRFFKVGKTGKSLVLAGGFAHLVDMVGAYEVSWPSGHKPGTPRRAALFLPAIFSLKLLGERSTPEPGSQNCNSWGFVRGKMTCK